MINPQLHKFLTIASWGLIAFGPLLTAMTLFDLAMSQQPLVQGPVSAVAGVIVGLVSPVVSGGMLLVLLSIDSRLSRKES